MDERMIHMFETAVYVYVEIRPDISIIVF